MCKVLCHSCLNWNNTTSAIQIFFSWRYTFHVVIRSRKIPIKIGVHRSRFIAWKTTKKQFLLQMIILREKTGAGFKTNIFFWAGKVVIIAISTVCATKEAFHVTSLQATGENHATFEVTMLCARVKVQCKTRDTLSHWTRPLKILILGASFLFNPFCYVIHFSRLLHP